MIRLNILKLTDILALCVFTEAAPAIPWEFANALVDVLIVRSR